MEVISFGLPRNLDKSLENFLRDWDLLRKMIQSASCMEENSLGYLLHLEFLLTY